MESNPNLFSNRYKFKSIATAMIVATTLFLGSATNGQDIAQRFKNFKRDVHQKLGLRKAEPKTASDNAIEQLAHEIDWLENYMDQYGSIVAKHPDVWGESRLTKFRREIEDELQKRTDKFVLRDNAAIRRSDIADLAAALSIGIAADATSRNSSLSIGDNGQMGASIMSTTTPPTEEELKANPNAKPKTETTTNHTINFKQLASSHAGDPSTSSLEPVIELNQRNRYLNHLMQLRRINEGDDTSDAPGYALNLIRIPVSILPGRATRRGYGAEVTISTTPYTSRALLPNTFRNLVINDVVDQLSLPIVRIAESDTPNDPRVTEFIRTHREILQAINLEIDALNKKKVIGAKDFANTLNRLGNMLAQNPVTVRNPDELEVELFANVLAFIRRLETAFNNLENFDSLKADLTSVTAYFKFLFQHNIQEFKLKCQIRGVQCEPETLDLIATSEDEKKLIAEFEKKERQDLENETPKWRTAFAKAIKSDQPQVSLRESFQLKGTELPFKSQQMEKILEKNGTNSEASIIDDLVEYKKVLYRKQYSNLSPGASTTTERYSPTVAKQQKVMDKIRRSTNAVSEQITKIYEQTFAVFALQSKSRRARLPVPPIHAIEIFGFDSIEEISVYLKRSYQGRFTTWNESDQYKGQIHLVDARQFLRINLDSAYDVISSNASGSPRSLVDQTIQHNRVPGNPNGQTLADLIRLGKLDEVRTIRKSFLSDIRALGVKEPLPELCWWLVVEMAVLNKQLNDDIQQMAVTNSKCRCSKSDSFKYYTPMPRSLGRCSSCNLARPVESKGCSQCGCDTTNTGTGDQAWQSDFVGAADQFCEYVNCRWPIQVFTIDPVHQEQNVSDASVVKRELAIAAALSFAQGKISLSQLTSFQRQFQEDISTVALNRTQVGFVHGNDTFGWRFSPRIQTRSPQGNIRAFNETLYGRGADANLKEAMLEPGIRECTAIVLMPSFVPYCDFDVRTNWHRLDKPTHSDVSMKETMRLSRAIRSMQNSKAACERFATEYRHGEADRLLRRVEQLERELPLQSMQAQIPYENTLGGMELFNNGLTDLAPELVGWYGAPGINIKAPPVSKEDTTKVVPVDSPPTTLFLVGDNLSVHETKIIAGGVEIKEQTLISRQVIQVTIPDNVRTVTIDKKRYVAVYAATPYGVTGHMHIPIVVDEAKSALAETLEKEAEKIKAIEKRLKELENVEFKWDAKPDLDIEIGFGVSDDCCQIGCVQSGSGDKDYKIARGDLSRQRLDRNAFAIIARIKDSKGNVQGKSFKLFDSIQIGAGNRSETEAKTKTSTILTKDNGHYDLIDFIEENFKSKAFEKENTLSFTVEAYIAFVEGGNYSTPIKIDGDIKLTVTATEACATKCKPATSSGGTTTTPTTTPATTTPATTPAAGTAK